MDVWGEYVQLTLESTGYNEMIYLGAAFGVVFGLYLAIRVFHAEAPKIAARPTWPVLLELPLMLNDFVMLFMLGFTLGFLATYLLALRLLKWFALDRARVTDRLVHDHRMANPARVSRVAENGMNPGGL